MRLSSGGGEHAVRADRTRRPHTGLACLAAVALLGGVLVATASPDAYGQSQTGAPLVRIAMAHEPADPAPGDPLTYTVWLTNDSAADAPGYLMTTELPPVIADATWTCRALGPGSACGQASGAGDVRDVADVGRGGGAVIYSVFTTVEAGGDRARELSSYTASATVTPPAVGACDPCAAGTTVGEIPTVTLRKTYHPRDPGPAPGEAMGFTITLTNESAADATGYLVDGPPPAELVDVSWTCRATGAGSACGSGAGTGHLLDVADVGADGGTVVYFLTGTVDRRAGGAPFRQHVTLLPGPGQACEPVATTTRTELDYYRSSYGAPPVVEAVTCRVNNLVQPANAAVHTAESLADTGSLAISYALAGLAAVACGGLLVLSARRRTDELSGAGMSVSSQRVGGTASRRP